MIDGAPHVRIPEVNSTNMRDLVKENAQLRVQNDQLRAQNTQICVQNKKLNDQVKQLTEELSTCLRMIGRTIEGTKKNG